MTHKAEGYQPMSADKDPRTDRSTDGPKQPAPQAPSHQEPSGVGSGTKQDPAKAPDAQPGKK